MDGEIAKPTAPPEPSKPKLHPVHCDPTLDVTLISKDNVEFRASSFQLSQFSEFFQGLFSLPPPNNGAREAIHLDFEGSTVAKFLDLMLLPERYHSIAINELRHPDLIAPLIGLADFAACKNTLLMKLREALRHHCRFYPLEILKFASDNDEREIGFATAAIRHFDKAVGFPGSLCVTSGEKGHCLGRWKKIRSEFAKLSPAFQVELFTITLIRCYARSDANSHTFNRDDWEKISKAFDPSLSMYDKLAKMNGWTYGGPRSEDDSLERP
ncbi:uncharacterized protein I303_104640 [Kwoniella dejecticola CBS 10117]|uniref:BTB domain-containing protein n=1 Tax=Kwoniella dejecticola CBS 10117 TaxID=1296121 RepID=A0A1A6A4S3_9TREE|nr:uncharacterized protein I303_04380 [Kwoniella dejecticola CBS 10117]OBR85052.1 hypothetical protein I303_04380 [Kwoniella dejecticola CBS 10117]